MKGAARAAAFLAAVFLPPTALLLGGLGLEGLVVGPLLTLLVVGLPFTFLTGEPLLALAGSMLSLLVLALWTSRGGLKRLVAALILVYAYIAVASFMLLLSGAASGL